MNSSTLAARPLDHVAVAVHSLEEALDLYVAISGDRASTPITLEAQGVRVAFVGDVELLEPLGPDTPVGRFLERRGPGLHHVAYRTDDIRSDLDRLQQQGFQLIDDEPRPGAHGLVAFLHPAGAGGVLVELVQRED